MRACLAIWVLGWAAGCDCGSSRDRGDEDAGPDDGGIRIDAGPPADAGLGLDAGPGVDAGPTDCTGTSASDLPGVEMSFPEQRCTFTLAEAAAGIDITYDVVATEAVTVTVRPQDGGGCGTPGPSGLITFEMLEGGGERYCLCDTGLCPGSMPTVTITPGSYRITFHWEGRNWSGPSDTGMPMGDPFPPGDYTLRTSAVGTHDGTPFTVEATFPVRLVP